MHRTSRSVLTLALSWGCLTFAAGCGSPPRIQEGANLHLLAALRTACSTQNSEWLENVAEQIDARHAEGSLSDTEHQAFQRVIETARASRWQEAEQQTHRFQRAQQR